MVDSAKQIILEARLAGGLWPTIADSVGLTVDACMVLFKDAAAVLNDTERGDAALVMRMAGISARDIERETGWRGVARLVKAASEVRAESAADERPFAKQLILDTLDALKAAHWEGSRQGLVPHTAMLLQLEMARANLYGFLRPDSEVETVAAPKTLTRQESLELIPPTWLHLSKIPEKYRPKRRASVLPSQEMLDLIKDSIPEAWINRDVWDTE